ncbi:MAG: hypothetical protein J6U53_04460 [Tidjanibacter sp.]|nr:hypothetical protein [Tidjanibacter sp.]
MLFVLVGLLVGCEMCGDGEGAEVLSMRALTSRYEGYPQTITDRVVVEGEVVSTDRSGENYNRVMVQDPSGGAIFMVDCDTLHLLHSIGDRLRIECRGLTIGGYGRGVRLGLEGEGEQIKTLTLADWLTRSEMIGVSKELYTNPTTIGTLSAAHLYTRVVIEGVRFEDAGDEWAEESESISRKIVDNIHTTDTLQVRVSGYSEFRGERIPSGVCDVVGVLDYFGNNYQLLLASPDLIFVRE